MFIRVRGILAIAKPPTTQGSRMNLHRLARSCPSSRERLVERIAAGWSVAKAAHAAGVSERIASRRQVRAGAAGRSALGYITSVM
jgi:hypothetical protein